MHSSWLPWTAKSRAVFPALLRVSAGDSEEREIKLRTQTNMALGGIQKLGSQPVATLLARDFFLWATGYNRLAAAASP